MSTKAWAAPVAILIAIGVLAGCADDDPQSGDAPESASQQSDEAAPQSDGRELADWAVTTFLGEESTDICDVGTESLAKTFGEHGWCENDVAFTQTPVELSLKATCDTRDQGAPIAAGDLYLYIVEPAIQYTEDPNPQNALIVIVAEQDDEWQVADMYAKDTDPDDPKAGACPYGGLQLLDESIPLA